MTVDMEPQSTPPQPGRFQLHRPQHTNKEQFIIFDSATGAVAVVTFTPEGALIATPVCSVMVE